jgi:uncharacterized repeat protein (TIGR01451 family)
MVQAAQPVTRVAICADPNIPTCAGEDFRFQGAAGSEFGFSTAMGYLNNDLFKDLVIGAPAEGRVYVFFGKVDKSGFPASNPNTPIASIASGAADIILTEVLGDPNSRFGFAVAIGASDPNDPVGTTPLRNPLIIGAPGRSLSKGAAYVVPEAAWIDSGFLTGPKPVVITSAPGAVTINGSFAGDEFGYSVALGPVRTAGGYDFIVGARKAGVSSKGTVYVFSETTTTPLATSSAVSITGDLANGGLGEQVLVDNFLGNGEPYEVAMSGVGTIPSDANNPAGRVYVVPIGSTNIDLTSPPGGTLRVQGDTKNDFFGFTLASGDFDGGVADVTLAVGAIYADRPTAVTSAQKNAGAVYIFRPTQLMALTGSPIKTASAGASHIIWGRRLWDELGFGLAASQVDDPNNPIEDLVAAARWHETILTDPNAVDAGSVFVFHGATSFPSLWSNCTNAVGVTATCTRLDCANAACNADPNDPFDSVVLGGGFSGSASDEMGFSLAVGDFNHDAKFADVAVSSLTHGRVYLVSLNNEDANAAGQPAGQEHDAVGDARDRDDDGDGYLDIEEDFNTDGIEDSGESDPLIPNLDVTVSFDPNTPSVYDCDSNFPVRILVTNASRKLAIPAGALRARVTLSPKLQCNVAGTCLSTSYTALSNVLLNPGESHVITFDVKTVDEPGYPTTGHSILVEIEPLTNELTAPYDAPTVVPLPNSATRNITLECPDLEVDKVADDNTPDVRSNVTFTVTLCNTGTAQATGVKVTDLLANGYTFVSSNPSMGTYNSGNGMWDVGTISQGTCKTLGITAAVEPSGSYTNMAEVTASTKKDLDSTAGNADPLEDDYKSITPVPVPVVDLSVDKELDPNSSSTPEVKTDVVFTVTVCNAATYSDATNVKVKDELPPGYKYESDDSATTSTTYNNGTGIWTIGNLPAGTCKTLKITAKVKGNGNYNNCAEVNMATQKDADSVPDNASTTEDDDDCQATTPVEVVDLSLAKAVDDATPDVNSDVVFTLTLANDNDFSDAAGVNVTDLLPNGYAYVSDDSATTSTSYDPNTGVWMAGSVASGASKALKITATVKPNGTYANCAEVTSLTPFKKDFDSTPGNTSTTEDDDDCVTPVPVPAVDLSLDKTVDNATPDVNTNVVFTLTLANAANFSDASAVTLTDLLPAGYTYVSDDSASTSTSYNGGTGVWTVGALASGSSKVLNITALVKPSGSYNNCGEVTTATPPKDADSTPGNSSTTEDDDDCQATTPSPTTDLSLTKTVDNSAPDVKDDVVFTLTLSNATGFSNATSVQVTDNLPSGYIYKSDDSATTSTTYNNGTGVWSVGALAAGSTKVLNITAEVKKTGTYENCGEVTAATPTKDFDSTPGNSSTTEDDDDCEATTPNAQVDLSVNKTVDDATPDVLSDVVFTVTVSNASGFSDATGVTVTDLLPSGYTYVSDDSASTSTTYNSGTGVWTVGSVAEGTTKTLNITATVKVSGGYNNCAEVTAATPTADLDSTPGNSSTTEDDDDCEATVPVAIVDLSLAKIVDDPTPTIGNDVVFTVTVTNAAGFSNATGVLVKDLLPSGYTYVSDDSATTSTTYNSGTGIWTVGTVTAGASVALNITATVEATGVYTNTAEVNAANETDTDSTPDNNNSGEDDQASVSTAPSLVAPPPSGVIQLALDGGRRLTWDSTASAASYHIYRGDLAVLRSTGIYIQSTSSSPDAQRFCSMSTTQYDDGFEPGAGKIVFYLVSMDDGTQEGSLGQNSAGQEIPNDDPCR